MIEPETHLGIVFLAKISDLGLNNSSPRDFQLKYEVHEGYKRCLLGPQTSKI